MMLALVFIVSAAALQSVHGSSGLRMRLEARQSIAIPEGWVKQRQIRPKEEVSLVFAVKQSNRQQLEDLFWAVSTPGSKLYRDHFTHEQVNELVAPTQSSIESLTQWLSGEGLDVAEKCQWTKAKEFLSCAMPAYLANSLLDVTFSLFEHSRTKQTTVRATEHYTLPASVIPHVDFVGNVHRFPQVSEAKRPAKDVSGLVDLQTPSSLRERYKVANGTGGQAGSNIQAVAQFLGQYYGKSDLTEFFKLFGSGFAHRSDVEKIIGPNKFLSGGEANLDVQYIMSLGSNISTWFWSTAGEHVKQEPFLEWIMDIANRSLVPQVMSVSYGDQENSLSLDYIERINQEFMKQGLRGMSLLFASGDAGANCRNHVLYPFFPASSPYVTTVGGTEGFLAIGTEKATLLSSGGFSNIFSQPDYQRTDVSNYLSTSHNLPQATYNRTGRAYPDVAAMAMDYMIVDELIPQPVDGTSCATPAFAGIISLVNDALLMSGRKALGFLNPFLYQNAKALTDITEQCSGGCVNHGWCAAPGWDAVTGLGTPNYQKLLQAAMAA